MGSGKRRHSTNLGLKSWFGAGRKREREAKSNKPLTSNMITEPGVENRVVNTRTTINTASLRVHIGM